MTGREGTTAVELHPPQTEGASAGVSLLDPGSVADTTRLDDLDTALIGLLLDDGRMTNRELAAATGASETTVGVHIRRMLAQRVLIFTTLFDWEAAGFEWFVIAKVNVKDRPREDVARDIAALPECEAVALVFGEADVLAYFLAQDRRDMDTIIQHRLAAIDGIATLSIDIATNSTVSPRGKQLFLARNPPPVRLPSPEVRIDDLDVAIMQRLLHDGRAPSRAIAKELSVAEGTIRTRIQRISDSGLMRIVAMVEPLALGMAGVISAVGVRVERPAIASVAEKIRELPQNLFTAVTVGSVDISVALAAESHTAMLDTILNQIRPLKGVISTETLQFIDVVSFSPYMKRLT